MEKPSGPGTLSGSMAHITSTIYFSKNDFTKLAFISLEIREGIKDNKSALTTESGTPSSDNSG